MSSLLPDPIDMRKEEREYYSTFKVTQGPIQLNFMSKNQQKQQNAEKHLKILHILKSSGMYYQIKIQ